MPPLGMTKRKQPGAFAPGWRLINFVADLPPGGGVEEAFELPAADRVLQLADGLRLDLADALAGDLENPADLFERVGVAVAQAVAELDDLALAVGERLEHALDLVLEH